MRAIAPIGMTIDLYKARTAIGMAIDLYKAPINLAVDLELHSTMRKAQSRYPSAVYHSSYNMSLDLPCTTYDVPCLF